MKTKIMDKINKDENLKSKSEIIINPPPANGRCDCCGRHISELKPFGGPGDPLVGDFTGAYLVKLFRPDGPYDEEAEKAYEEAYRWYEIEGFENPLEWLTCQCGKEKGESLYYRAQLNLSVSKSWECRDCAVLDDYEYFEKLKQEDCMSKIEKLYTAISFIDIDDKSNVDVTWYRWGLNPQRSTDYSKLIKGYSAMDDRCKELSREFANEFFTHEEVELLRDYLSHNYGTDLYVCEHSLPIDPMCTKPNGEKTYLSSFTECSYSENTLAIYNAHYYDLPFEVSGRFDPDDGLPHRELPDDFADNGVRFVRHLLQSLKYNDELPDEQIYEAVKQIYKTHGYYAAFNLHRAKPEKDPDLMTFKTFYSKGLSN